MSFVSSFSFPTAIHFGAGARRLVPEHLRSAGVKRPLIVTDKGVAALPMTAALADDLRAAALEPALFGGVWGNPLASQVRAGVEAYRAHGADAVVGLGGGAALDVAKAVALMAGHAGDILDYAADSERARRVEHALPHFIALPTTAGTGSEVGRSAVISDDGTHVKKIVFAPALLARAVFADPELTLDLPANITAATGMDALAHNVESYLSPAYHPLCDGIALEGARIAARALPAAVRDGRDLAARADMLMASMMGAIAFQKDLGVVHSCAHALGTVANLHHGLAVGIMFDHAMRFNAPAAETKLAELARVTGAGKNSADFVAWLARLKTEIGIPAKLDRATIPPEKLARLVDVAFADPCHQTNPRPCTRTDFEALFAAALG
ncbi:MAG TPA: iron-containing alcohol dehydrogenase [Opitutaceae bacterium]|nr:iron-containing alcohol dehydrogenase [Opitutaceae bacterium]